MVNTPARSGTSRNTWARPSVSHCRTAGCDVHRPLPTPRISARFWKNSGDIARGSLMYR